MARETEPMLQATDLHKSFGGNEVLHGVDLAVMAGELTLITGPSGSGKTTLLNIVAGIEHPTSGTVSHENQEVSGLRPAALTDWRARHTGYVFQRSGLLGGLTAKENILAPHSLMENSIDKVWAATLCARLGIAQLLDQSALELSGGEKQRVSIARALVHQPDILFADEPDASLDTEAKVEIHEIIRDLVDSLGVTVAMVSHNPLSAKYADRITTLQDGKIVTSGHFIPKESD